MKGFPKLHFDPGLLPFDMRHREGNHRGVPRGIDMLFFDFCHGFQFVLI